MNDRDTVVIDHDTDLERVTARGRTDEQRHVRIIRLIRLPMVPKGMDHFLVRHAVLACRRFDVREPTLPTRTPVVNRC